MPAKLSAEIMGKSGHDIISLEMHYPWLFQPGLVDVSDICNDLSRKHGDWYTFAKEHALVKGSGSAFRTCTPRSRAVTGSICSEKIGEREPDTWDDLLRAGRKLKKLGHPVGFAISQTTDSVSTLYSILWSYGAKDVAEDGKTIAINSKQTEAVIDYVQALYTDAMDPAVLSWDNAGNNQWLNSGKGSWIHNPISHYVVAKQEKLAVAELTGFHPSPAGPAGRHTVGVPRSLGFWKFSKNVDVARDFMKWFFEPAQYQEWIMSGDSYNHPTWRDMENHPVWDVDKKYKPIKGMAKYSHLYGWPAPPDEKIQLITNSYIIPQHVRARGHQRLEAQGGDALGRDRDQAGLRTGLVSGTTHEGVAWLLILAAMAMGCGLTVKDKGSVTSTSAASCSSIPIGFLRPTATGTKTVTRATTRPGDRPGPHPHAGAPPDTRRAMPA